AGKYREALVLLEKGTKANPLTGYSEFLEANVYFHLQKYDSAAMFAEKAFYTRPKAKTYYQTLMAVLSMTNDSARIQKAFNEYNAHRMHPFGWDLYIRAMLKVKGYPIVPKLLAFADSGLNLFKGDATDTLLRQRKNELQALKNNAATSGTNAANQQALLQKLAKAQDVYNKAIADFAKAKAATPPADKPLYLAAAANFLKAGELSPNNYVIWENAGICYFNIHEYRKAIVYFDKAIEMNVSKDGKSEYFKGASHYNLGEKDGGCKWIALAASKGYSEAAAVLKNNCK
ncbi:MAG: hypothetical protein JO301_09690, partial [Chitinophagaceae bacterium]|nr:hypothetical protein [Chitinophagaceae bacterium]